MKGIIYLFLYYFVCFSLNVNADFQVRVKNINNSSYEVPCSFVYNKNNYQTSVTTTTSADYWRQVDGNKYDLRFDRVDNENAIGGRCETGLTNTFAGDGIFSSHFYVHSNVKDSSGVFTVAIFPEEFSQEKELDLIVVNVKEDTVKSGQPFEAESIPLSIFTGQWITVIMKKENGVCQSNFYSSSGQIVYATKPASDCHTGSGNHRILINSRSRDGNCCGNSYVTIDSVSWEQL